MKAMFLIFTGLGFLIAGMTMIIVPLYKEWQSTTYAKTPKVNNHRVVQMSDGTYRIQYYWTHPGWISWDIEFPSEERARSAMSAIDKKKPVVVKVLE